MSRIRWSLACLVPLMIAEGSVAVPDAGEVDALIAKIKAVGAEGSGNTAASEASKKLAGYGIETVFSILKAMDDADAVAANWLRPAVEAIAERETMQGRPLPVADLEAFVLDQRHAGRVRRFAFELLSRVDATAEARLIPGMLNDPGLELRRDAVARAVAEAQRLTDADDKPAAQAAFQKAFAAARDHDQVMDLSKRLESLGKPVDLTKHFGCVQRWQLVAPFDNRAKAGFGRPYPPEQAIKLDAEYDGQSAEGPQPGVRWIEHVADDQFGVVDLNKVIAKHMGAVAYAATHVESSRERPVRIHVGSPNAIKLWLNGKLIYSRDEYHHGMSMDQYQATGVLKTGRNTILLKVCQNEQKDEWAQNWTFQLRVCDPTGRGLEE